MNESWRWFGKDDPVSLDAISQSGASHVVSALDDDQVYVITNGDLRRVIGCRWFALLSSRSSRNLDVCAE